MADTLLRSPLYDRHVAMGARMAEEGDWETPLSYQGPLEEAAEARRRAIVADISHFGRLRIKGDGALALLEKACTADVATQQDGTALATAICNERGGMIDLCELLRLEDYWLLVASPGARHRVLEHLAQLAGGLEVKVQDQTENTVQLAVLGPAGAEILDKVLPIAPSQVPPRGAVVGSMLIASYIAWRTSPAGGWGLQVVVPNMIAGMAWDFITKKAGPNALKPAGAAAMDVLRLEALVPAHGREFNETIDPITAGLEVCVDWEHDFVGKAALQAVRDRGPARKRVGLVTDQGLLNGKSFENQDDIDASAGQLQIPRMGATILDADGAEVGTVTSATFSPTAAKIIAMGYVAARLAVDGQPLKLAMPSWTLDATVKTSPFVA